MPERAVFALNCWGWLFGSLVDFTGTLGIATTGQSVISVVLMLWRLTLSSQPLLCRSQPPFSHLSGQWHKPSLD